MHLLIAFNFKTISELNLGRLTGRHSTFIASRTRGYKFISIQYPLYPLPLEERIQIELA